MSWDKVENNACKAQPIDGQPCRVTGGQPQQAYALEVGSDPTGSVRLCFFALDDVVKRLQAKHACHAALFFRPAMTRQFVRRITYLIPVPSLLLCWMTSIPSDHGEPPQHFRLPPCLPACLRRKGHLLMATSSLNAADQHTTTLGGRLAPARATSSLLYEGPEKLPRFLATIRRYQSAEKATAFVPYAAF